MRYLLVILLAASLAGCGCFSDRRRVETVEDLQEMHSAQAEAATTRHVNSSDIIGPSSARRSSSP
jgi:hypothetical protein